MIEGGETEPVIFLKNIEFQYPHGDFRLRIDELKVSPGEKIAFIGPSGSGKTTLLNLISGILKPHVGHIQVGDQDISKLADSPCRDFRVSNIGLVFQEFELLEYLTVLDNILLPFRISPVLKLNASIRERAIQLAKDVGIEDKLHRYTNQMSQGERQRVAICRALLPNPGLVMADEPTGNLDPANKAHVLEILFECVSKTNATLLAVTHDTQIVNRFDRVVDFSQFQFIDNTKGNTGVAG
jgi:putative ABC transport system ATP-binding protein